MRKISLSFPSLHSLQTVLDKLGSCHRRLIRLNRRAHKPNKKTLPLVMINWELGTPTKKTSPHGND